MPFDEYPVAPAFCVGLFSLVFVAVWLFCQRQQKLFDPALGKRTTDRKFSLGPCSFSACLFENTDPNSRKRIMANSRLSLALEALTSFRFPFSVVLAICFASAFLSSFLVSSPRFRGRWIYFYFFCVECTVARRSRIGIDGRNRCQGSENHRNKNRVHAIV